MSSEDWKKPGITEKFPSYRNFGIVTVHSWQVGKRQDDEAEGLWRIYDGIYDFTDFIEKHPGGPFWLRETKGTDITEAFESHHLRTTPEQMIAKYKVRDAAKPRNYKLTMHEDGFYKTLKRRVREKMSTIDYSPKRTSDLIHLSMLTATFALVIASVRFNSLLALVLAALSLTWTVIISHNYFHKRDNWQMYTYNLCAMNFCSWRISHAISHHAYPNSFVDLEMSMWEPFMCWVPNPHIKGLAARYISWFTGPIIYWFGFFMELINRIYYSLRYANILYWHDLITFIFPVVMYLTSNWPFLLCMRQWAYLIMLSSFIFSVIGFNAAHHDPEIYHEGDAMREDRDWGLYQVDCIIDRGDLKGSQFLVLTHFGDHILHHLFPTLDHGILPQLYPILHETLAQFKGKVREINHLQHMIGQHKQLIRIHGNPRKPGSTN